MQERGFIHQCSDFAGLDEKARSGSLVAYIGFDCTAPSLHVGNLVGIISERDYARKVILKNRSSQDTPVSEIMTAQPVTVTLTDTVRHCMEIMTQNRFRHLPVVEGGRVLGILSIGDLVKAVIEEQTAQIEQLERYIAG